ncbi:MAG TPA: GNAT family N-acetyltransferase [Candidatus Paceibacterota bacterium]|nr:GNAT family N-acetyltransferase [Candidatus Paceibacterota bacterium]
MSLEYAIERFPLKVTLRDGTETVIRPLGKKDESKLSKFFSVVPEPERLFIKKPVSDPTVIKDWCRNADYEQNLPLLMLHGSKVIGEANLHQRLGGWKRHIGIVTVLTHPDYRGRDVAKTLVEEIVLVARHLGLKKLEAELNGERKVAIRALELIGFHQLYRLPDYVLDMQSKPHDYVMMGMDLRVPEEYAGVG